MPKRRYFQLTMALLALPFFSFSFFYAMRWVISGQWVQGGGDRAVAGFFIGLLLLFPALFAELAP